MGTSPVTAITGIFGATQEARAAKEALRILNEARETALTRSKALYDQYAPFAGMSRNYLDQAGAATDASQALLQNVIAQAQGLDVGQGLSGADQIAYQDAARLLNEQLVGTGNLRELPCARVGRADDGARAPGRTRRGTGLRRRSGRCAVGRAGSRSTVLRGSSQALRRVR